MPLRTSFAVSNSSGLASCVMSPVCSTNAGLCGSALSLSTASRSVAVTSLFASLLKPMWLSLIWAKKMLFRSRVGEERQPAHREGLWNSARHSPDGRRSRPRHAAQESSAIDAVVAVVRRDIVAAGRTRISVFVEPVVVAVVMMAHLNLSPGCEVVSWRPRTKTHRCPQLFPGIFATSRESSVRTRHHSNG